MIRVGKSTEKEIRKIKIKQGFAFTDRTIQNDSVHWDFIVKEIENGYGHLMCEYLNDLATRWIIQTIIDNLSDKDLANVIEQTVKPIDDRLKALLIETDKCVWGVPNEWRYQPPDKYFWVWGIVNNAKGELLRDLLSYPEPVKFNYYRKK